MQAWAQSVAAGIPDDVYWRSTPLETAALLDQLIEMESRRERAKNLRAGLVAAEIKNTMRTKRTDRYWTPWDFMREREPALGPEHFESAMDAWALWHNSAISRKAVA